ncbi:MAG: hypothetical protein DCC58_14115 [Chloroflexi bacterium]|nr:MAG: hypothetical protein DCC58_14115 [Chloroflexota bacterium]
MDFGRLVEDKIRDAIDAGVFDNLRGAGKPFDALEDSSGENWMAFHILKSNGFLPEWLELRKQIAAQRDSVLESLAAWRAAIQRYGDRDHILSRDAGSEYRRRAKAINALIDLHNLRCPTFAFEIARFREDIQP